MRWRQFFTPVKSLDADQARQYLAEQPPEKVTILDVRQPQEYKKGHIPGAKLVPLTQLDDRLDEIDPHKPTVVYCAVGGRSRVAAQMLSGKGFDEVFNLSGGIKAWNSETAIGPQDQGMALFEGSLTSRQSLIVAYSMEQGLRDFYLSMAEKVRQDDVRGLFENLADIEIKHQQHIFEEYKRSKGTDMDIEAFEAQMLPGMVEGGLTTDEYLSLYNPDLSSKVDVVSMAMSIEAQALDLYQRAADRATDEIARDSLLKIAGEEKAHLEALGKLMEQL
jgi:rhodanese-related sulfurtransferase/rubrerythrin